MLEPISRNVAQDVFGFHSVFASKFLDAYSVFDWGRMPDGIPYRGKLQSLVQAYLHQKFLSKDEWTSFFRSADALAFRKAGKATAHLNELADSFPMKSAYRGLVGEESFRNGKWDPENLTPSLIRKNENLYLLSDAYPEEKVVPISVMGKPALDFTAWKSKKGMKALPFEFDCEFSDDFPAITLKCVQSSFVTEVSITEALLITELSTKKLEELMLRTAWIAGFIQFQLKAIDSMNDPFHQKKNIRIRMGANPVHPEEFVFLSAGVDFIEMESELQKFYSSTVWGKVVAELHHQARSRAYGDWKKHCTEPAPWLDPAIKNEFSNQYQKMISGISSCLSE